SIANLAWCTALCAVRVHNPSSNYQYDDRAFEADRKRIFRFYAHKPPIRRRLLYLRLKLIQIEREIRSALGTQRKSEPVSPDAFPAFYNLIAEKMSRQNTDTPVKFLYRGMPASQI